MFGSVMCVGNDSRNATLGGTFLQILGVVLFDDSTKHSELLGVSTPAL